MPPRRITARHLPHWCRTSAPHSAWLMASCTCHIPDTLAIAALITAGSLACQSIILPVFGAWATTAIGGGIWGHGGVASDGTNIFVVTGNTFNTGGTWGGGEAIIRLQPGPIFSGNPGDYWAPTNWLSLDNGDIDVGGCGAVTHRCSRRHTFAIGARVGEGWQCLSV